MQENFICPLRAGQLCTQACALYISPVPSFKSPCAIAVVAEAVRDQSK